MAYLKSLLFAAMLLGIQQVQAESRLERIRTEGVLRACIWPDYYSISWRDPRSQTLSGIDIDLTRALAGEMQVKLEYVDSSFATLIGDLLEERCDVASFAIGVIPERAKYLEFTQPYLVSDVLAVTTRTNRRVLDWEDIDQSRTVVAVAKGTLQEPLMRTYLKQARLITLKPPKTREQEVLSGRADVFMTDFPYARRMLETTDWARLVEPPSPQQLTYYTWAVKPGDAVWLAHLDDFINRIKHDGRLLEAAKKHKLDPILVTE